MFTDNTEFGIVLSGYHGGVRPFSGQEYLGVLMNVRIRYGSGDRIETFALTPWFPIEVKDLVCV